MLFWLEAHGLVVLAGLLVATTAIVMLQQRRSPQATIAWLMFLVVVPYVAIPAFAVMGFRKRLQSGPAAPFQTAAAPRPGEHAPQIERMLCRYGLGAASEGNRFSLQTGGEESWAALTELVADATTSLDVTLYALGNDPVGRAFCAMLANKARQGVAVRVILDRFGSLWRPRRALRELTGAGGEVRLHSPILNSPSGGNLNLRIHRKMVIADGARVWSGGRNVAEEYLGPEPVAGRWHDLSFVVDGPATVAFSGIFISDWKAANGRMESRAAPIPREKGTSKLQIVPAGPDVSEDPLHDALVFACHAAARRVWIVTPYYLPTPALSEALAIAARRGVDVRLLIPAKSNQRLADLARGAWLRDLEDSGCRIHLHPEMVHAKAVLADGLAFTGSANLDARSLLLNFEMAALLFNNEDVEILHRWAEGLLAEAPVGIRPAGRIRRAVEALFRLGSPIL